MEFLITGIGLVVALLMIVSARNRHRDTPPRDEEQGD
jgi:hypothetical protein